MYGYNENEWFQGDPSKMDHDKLRAVAAYWMGRADAMGSSSEAEALRGSVFNLQEELNKIRRDK